MPRLLIQSQLLPIPNNEMTKMIAEAVEVAGLVYVYDSGMLDNFIDNSMLQMGILGGVYTAYDRMLLQPEFR
jgi:hypothetical protein